MQSLLTQTLAWVAAALVAVLLALNVPEQHGVSPVGPAYANGAATPR